MIGQRSVKLAVTDQAYAETVLSLPTTGSLPEQAGQIALDELTMNSLGVPHQLGAPVSLQWTDPQGEPAHRPVHPVRLVVQPNQLFGGLRLGFGRDSYSADAGL